MDIHCCVTNHPKLDVTKTTVTLLYYWILWVRNLERAQCKWLDSIPQYLMSQLGGLCCLGMTRHRAIGKAIDPRICPLGWDDSKAGSAGTVARSTHMWALHAAEAPLSMKAGLWEEEAEHEHLERERPIDRGRS